MSMTSLGTCEAMADERLNGVACAIHWRGIWAEFFAL